MRLVLLSLVVGLVGCAQPKTSIRPAWVAEFPPEFFAETSKLSAPATPAKNPHTITVQIAGAVRFPGELSLPAGASLLDAIIAAGGAYEGGFSGYRYSIRRATRLYTFRARDGIAGLREFSLHPGDMIYAVEQ